MKNKVMKSKEEKVFFRGYKTGFHEACDMIKKMIREQLGNKEKWDIIYPTIYLTDEINQIEGIVYKKKRR